MNLRSRSDRTDKLSPCLWVTVARTRTQENKTNPEFCNVEVTNTEFMKKVFRNLQNKLAGVQNLPEFAMEACKSNMFMW